MKERTIFDYMNAIFDKRSISFDKKICSSYLLSLWLSHDKGLIECVNAINEFQFLLSDELIYQYYYDKVPMGRRYIKWVKKDEEDKKSKDIFDSMRKDLNLSKKEAANYKQFTSMMKTDKIDKKTKGMNASSIFLKRS